MIEDTVKQTEEAFDLMDKDTYTYGGKRRTKKRVKKNKRTKKGGKRITKKGGKKITKKRVKKNKKTKNVLYC